MTRRPMCCSRCPDQATHMALVNGPVAEFARAHGESNPTVLAILDAEDAHNPDGHVSSSGRGSDVPRSGDEPDDRANTVPTPTALRRPPPAATGRSRSCADDAAGVCGNCPDCVPINEWEARQGRSQAVQDALSSLLWLTACRCEPAWTERSLHAPDCQQEYREDVDTLRAALTDHASDGVR